MSAIRARGKRQRRNVGASGMDQTAPMDGLTHVHPPPRVEVHRAPASGRLDHARRAALPLTDRQQQVLDALTSDPQAPSAIARHLGLRPQQVSSALLFLSSKDHAVHTDEGWRRA